MNHSKTANHDSTAKTRLSAGKAGGAINRLLELLAWLCKAAVLAIPLSGCQLVNMARFSYANATATRDWAGEERSTTVPFRMIDNHIILPVRVNGSQPLNFVLDSGAGASVIIDSRSSRALQLKMGGEIAVSGTGTGPDPTAHIVPDTRLSLGEASLEGLSVIYLPLEAIPFFDDLDHVYFDGVIGTSFFTRFVVEINYDLQLLTFTEPSAAVEQLANLGSRWREIPLQIKSGLPYMSARVTPKPGQSVDVKLLVDTGFRGSLSLTPASHDDLDEPTEYLESIDQGLSGDVTSRVSMSESLALADYQLSGLPIGYALAGGERENGSNGIVGNEVLQQFNLVFDYANERLFLTPNASFGTRINADRSGLQIRPHVAGAIIKGIAPGSTGQASPLKPGDIITSFDDMPVNYQSIAELKRALASERGSVKLCWLSAATMHCQDLPLANRITDNHPPNP